MVFVCGVLLLAIVTPLSVIAENFATTGESYTLPYTTNRSITSFDSITEISNVMHEDFICGGNQLGAPGDDCIIDQSTTKGLYVETFDEGTRFDKRKLTIENFGEPHYVHLDVFVCYKMPISNSAPDDIACARTVEDLYYEETHTFEFYSHLGNELYVYIVANEGSGGDQTRYGIKVEIIEFSNEDHEEPRELGAGSTIADQVCQESCDSDSDSDKIDAFEFSFHKGDSFEIEFWSTECEPSHGNVNYQIAVNVYIFTPSNPNLAASYYWYLNEQDCGRDDRYESISITNASKGGDLLITFLATDDHGDENPSSYEVSLVTHDISNRDLIHDEDQDGVPDVQESQCGSNYWYDQDVPQDTDGDLECDVLDNDDDGDGVPDTFDHCPVDFIEQATSRNEDHDGDGCQNSISLDDDSDGINDLLDSCPLGIVNILSNENNDFDNDGCLDQEDDDDDNDGWSDILEDNCETNSKDFEDIPDDLDGDYICDNLDDDVDGDGFEDDNDSFPRNSDEWEDNDLDGIGNNADLDDDGDEVNDVDDEFPLDPTQSSDFDGDGCGDNHAGLNGDQFPNEPSQCFDSDGDGYGDNQSGIFPDLFPHDATQWNDVDGDGFGDNPNGVLPDKFPLDSTQWVDTDGDGYGDNQNGNSPDLFPYDPTQWNDIDGDGFGDNSNGNNGDSCHLTFGTSYRDLNGCPDMDSDGWSNGGDDCPEKSGPSVFDRKGCNDSDGDGYSDSDSSSPPHPLGAADAFPFDSSQYRDSDGDGYGDNISGQNSDICPNMYGNSSIDRMGCPDQDGDGWSDDNDAFKDDSAQWNDSDGDGFGDESDNRNGDACPNIWGTSTSKNARGCLDEDGDGIRDDDDTCSGGKNQIQDTKNTCLAAVLKGEANIFEAQGATLLSLVPLIYFLIMIRKSKPPLDKEDSL